MIMTTDYKYVCFEAGTLWLRNEIRMAGRGNLAGEAFKTEETSAFV